MLTDQEAKQFIELANKIEPVMRADVFSAVAEKFVLTAVEGVILRGKAENLEIFLTQRPPDDLYWPNMWHIPGTIVRLSDIDPENKSTEYEVMYKKTFQRLEEKEIVSKFSARPKLLGTRAYMAERGAANSLVFLCAVKGEPKSGKFFPVYNLPDNFISAQQSLVDLAVENYEQK